MNIKYECKIIRINILTHIVKKNQGCLLQTYVNINDTTARYK